MSRGPPIQKAAKAMMTIVKARQGDRMRTDEEAEMDAEMQDNSLLDNFPKADWIRIAPPGRLVCERCKDSYAMNMPCPIGVMLGASRGFANDHQHCEAR